MKKNENYSWTEDRRRRKARRIILRNVRIRLAVMGTSLRECCCNKDIEMQKYYRQLDRAVEGSLDARRWIGKLIGLPDSAVDGEDRLAATGLKAREKEVSDEDKAIS